ncbi:hypothetical protein IAQ61_004910 [Plenodomus lingam]|uniref:uncharacterized protein n=1 Tax=Leptosphaeria maculans TaxID=5022 RepID=UPI0033342587|nr:hypothetical protein IAQ61_004910 [Plenodomus lingam]
MSVLFGNVIWEKGLLVCTYTSRRLGYYRGEEQELSGARNREAEVEAVMACIPPASMVAEPQMALCMGIPGRCAKASTGNALTTTVRQRARSTP